VDPVRPKSVNTISHVEQIVRAYLIPRFGNEIAEDIKPLAAPLHARAYLRRYSAPRFGDAGTALVGRAVE
jgi:hypothetical protein